MAMKQIHRRALSETSATASDLGTPGELRYDSDGNIYRLFRSLATLSHGASFHRATATASTASYGVNVAANSLNKPAGVHNQWTASISASDIFFWGQVRGRGPVLQGGTSAAAGANLVHSTAGAVAASATTLQHLHAFGALADVAVTVTGQMNISCEL
jgi:hypothetical protein